MIARRFTMTIYYYDLTAKNFGKLLREDLQSNYELGHMNPSTTIELKKATHLVWLMRRMVDITKPGYELMPDTFKKLYVHQLIQEERPDFFSDEFDNMALDHDDDVWRELEE